MHPKYGDLVDFWIKLGYFVYLKPNKFELRSPVRVKTLSLDHWILLKRLTTLAIIWSCSIQLGESYGEPWVSKVSLGFSGWILGGTMTFMDGHLQKPGEPWGATLYISVSQAQDLLVLVTMQKLCHIPTSRSDSPMPSRSCADEQKWAAALQCITVDFHGAHPTDLRKPKHPKAGGHPNTIQSIWATGQQFLLWH